MRTILAITALTLLLTGCRSHRSAEHTETHTATAETRRISIEELLSLDRNVTLDSVTIEHVTFPAEGDTPNRTAKITARSLTIKTAATARREAMMTDTMVSRLEHRTLSVSRKKPAINPEVIVLVGIVLLVSMAAGYIKHKK